MNEQPTVSNQSSKGKDFRVSQRIMLKPGDRFRASGGPYYETKAADGTIVRQRMRDSNPYVFLGWHAKNGRTYLEAQSPDGFAVLCLSPTHRHPDLPSYVKAPFTNIRRVGKTRRERADAQPGKSVVPAKQKKQANRQANGVRGQVL
jgi:hypothetical protein